MNNPHLKRQSPFHLSRHRLDKDLQLGYDYRNSVLSNSLSPLLFNNEKRARVLGNLNTLFVYLIDSVKNIKKTFVYSVSRQSRNIN